MLVAGTFRVDGIQAIVARAEHYKELSRFVVLIDVTDRHKIDAGRTPADRITELEIYPQLFDLGRSMQFVASFVEARDDARTRFRR